jgi:hypothetical protein
MSGAAVWTVAGGVLIVLVVFPAPGAAQEVDRATSLGRLVAGQELRIVLDDGLTRRGRLRALDPSNLTIDEASKAVTLEVARIIEVGRRGDGLWNGPIFGALVGVAVTGVVMLSECGERPGRCPDKAEFMLTYTGVGAGVGLLVDVVHVGFTTVYRRRATQVTVLPFVSSRQYGLMARVTLER